MSDEPKRWIEGELENWARARREQAGPEFTLDPFRRGQLHEEVARVQSDITAPPARPLWQLLLPRLAVGAGLALLLVFAVLHMASRSPRGRDEMTMARQDAAPAGGVNEPTVRAPAPAPARELEKDVLAPLPAPAHEIPQAPPPAAAPAMPPPKAQAAPADSRSRAVGTSVKRERSLEFDAVASRSEAKEDRYQGAAPRQEAPLSAVEPVARVDQPLQFAAQSVGVQPSTQLGAFAPQQALRRNMNSPPRRVLTRFTMETDATGGGIRVVDGDGSVYEGQRVAVRLQQQVDQGQVRSLSTVPAESMEEVLAEFAFQVQGTNRTTGERVVFEGTYEGGNLPVVRGSAQIGPRTRLEVEARAEGAPPVERQ